MVAVTIAGIATISLLNCINAAGKVTTRLEESFYARWLAHGIKAEMDLLPAVDPDQTPRFGCEAGEWSRNRQTFDDLDDYAGWTVSPPEDIRGLPNEELAGYTCSVKVGYLDPKDFTTTVQPGESDYILCTITINKDERQAYRLQWIRTIRLGE